MSDLFAEVDEIMRQERLTKIWQDNKTFIIGAIVGVILLTAVTSGYKSWNTSVQKKQTSIAFKLLNDADFPNNIDPETIKIRNSLKAMVILQAAAAQLEEGDADKALNLYQAAAAIKSAPQYQGLSRLMASRMQDAPMTDSLRPLAKNKKNIWRPQALLEIAAHEATENSNYAAALDAINTLLKSKNLPQSMIQKAEALKHVYTIKSIEKTKE